MSLFSAVQEDIRQWLKAREFFSNVEVITEDRGDVINEVQTALGKLGIVVVVEMLKGRVEFPGVGAGSIAFGIGMTVHENVVINRSGDGTKKTAPDAVVEIFDVFNPLNAATHQKSLPVLLEDFDLLNDSNGELIYQIRGKARGGWTRK